MDTDCPPGYYCHQGRACYPIAAFDLLISPDRPDAARGDLLQPPDLATLVCGGKPCSFPGASAVCDNGVCIMGACNAGFADCNGKPGDGCEVSTATSASNCGGCGKACSSAHMTAACAGGECIGNCAPNYADCNMDKRSDGCETSVASDANNCGACGKVCGDFQMCKDAKCV